jgi:thymidylate synthase (FAD)
LILAVKLRWATPDIDGEIAYEGRVSNSNAKPGDPYKKLIGYLISHKHWSPFEMANICLRVETTRDIGRQLLRHRSFHFQEFSQRYAEVAEDKPVVVQQARLQDPKNRQNSIPCEDFLLNDSWVWWQNRVWTFCWTAYQACLKMGVAKELARKLLPEGLVKTQMYVNGTVRDWFHYLAVRLDPSTQLEHRQLAREILAVCMELAPATFEHLNGTEES